MSEPLFTFIGAGQRNVVLQVSDASKVLDSPPEELKTNCALRISNVPPCECENCYKALKPFCGMRESVPLPEALFNEAKSVVPEKFHRLIDGATVATVVPNFSADPGRILADPARQRSVTEEERKGDYTIEIKPKSIWQRPVVVGIIVDGGEPIYIHPAKLSHCRYSQMLYYKAERDNDESLAQDVASSYCPNFFYSKDLSSLEGFERLKQKAINNLKVISCHPSFKEKAAGGKVPPADVIADADLKGIADALDFSEIFQSVGALQLYGTYAEDYSKVTPVLDIELLYPWTQAKDKESVQWLVLPADADLPCACTSEGYTPKTELLQQAVAQKPDITLETAIERFYCSVTAKDISLLLSRYCLRLVDPKNGVSVERIKDVLPSLGGVFVREGEDLFRVAAVDIDEKTNKTLDHYYEYDAKIVKAFENGVKKQ
ncbi:hypothetical protein AGDE_06179 [Angomonas deanei]|uniref:Inositol-pentakisphosphate 2-kinase n=1 Tax=Angomonas deanei TaxID=59799 RepID=S9WP63_9TRYP|nr:hypothetical protein AGDE_07912 [Angomonas deanei]EPY37755.1 hypothetical protein AGDE_06179 [Angomonas deanei]CAD2215790.1 Inositol-pentakisphosphate 2-kinase, putative [Angomonas deanei]|eukprot:EPY34445.1 hypothetical protein AGDE_07912 [Angomonas deanei]